MASKQWQPLADGEYIHDSIIDGRITMRIEDDGEDITIIGPEEMYESLSLSPFKYRLCRLVKVEVPAAPGVPPDIAYVTKKALERYRNRIEEVGTMGWYPDNTVVQQEIARIDAALQWLAVQEQGDGSPR